MDKYTLLDLCERTQIPLEKLRYVVDQKLLPGLTQGGSNCPGRGRPREYTEFEAFAIACAAYLLAAGLGRARVQKNMEFLCGIGKFGQRPLQEQALWRALHEQRVRHVEIGDDVNVRCAGPGTRHACWQQTGTGAVLGEGYEPLVTVAVDVARLRRCFRG